MREQQIADVFVELADTLVDDFDVIDFLHQLSGRCVSLLDVSAAGLLLTDQRDALRVIAASSEQTRLLELFQLQSDQGPCLDCFRSRSPVAVADLAGPDAQRRWPRFAAEARRTGFTSVHALPMRLRDEIIGALNLFDARPGHLNNDTLAMAQAFADVATIGLLQARIIRRGEILAEQLQTALNSRVLIEQAKGVVAERRNINIDDAFTQLRRAARDQNRRLSDLAADVVNGSTWF
jgi:transcriptional regulator with GAF, ATPase, and Fis domain